jgi:uncharacterized protein involved in outer membrane biogenesis
VSALAPSLTEVGPLDSGIRPLRARIETRSHPTMKKLIKILASVVLVLVVLVAAAAALVPMLVDPNDHRDRIATLVQQHTGRELRLEGPLSLSVFPWLGVDARAVVLGNAPGFEDPFFARADQLQVRVKLLPLVRRVVEMDTIKVAGLQLRLARDQSGRTNWDDLIAPGGGGDGGNGRGSPVAALALGGVDVEGGAVQWEDRQIGELVEIRNLDVRTGALRLDGPIPLEVEFDVVVSEPELAGHVRAKADLAVDLQTSRYEARGIEASADLTGATLPGGKARMELTGDGAYDLAENSVDASGLDLRVAGITIAGLGVDVAARGALRADLTTRRLDAPELAVDANLQGESLPGGRLAVQASANVQADLAAGTIALSGLNGSVPELSVLDGKARVAVRGEKVAVALSEQRVRIDGLVVNGEVVAARLPDGRLPFDVKGDGEIDLAAGRAVFTGITATAAELSATGEIQATGLDTEPRVGGTVALAGASPRVLAGLAGVVLPATRDPKALGSVAGEASFSAGGDSLDVERMRIKLDDSTIEGSLRLPSAAAPGMAFDVTVDTLDVDRYLPPTQDGAKDAGPAASPIASPGAAAAGAAQLPVEQLRALDLDGRLRVGALRASGLSLSRLDASVRAKDGLIRLQPLRAALYGGSYQGNVTVDARGDDVKVSVDERIEAVDAAALTAAAGLDPVQLGLSSGKSDLRLKASMTGAPTGGRFKLSGVDLDAALAGERFPGKRLAFGVAGAFDVDLPQQTATSDAFRLRYGGVQVEGKLAATRIADDPHLAGAVVTTQFDPRELLAQVGVKPPVTADPNALRTAALQATVTASAGALTLKGLDLRVDQSRLTGELDVRGFDQPAIRFDLDLDGIDVDRYLPPSSPRVAATPGAAVALLPVAALRALDLQGELRIGQLKLSGVRVSNARLSAQAKDGQARLNPLGAHLYGGAYQGDIRVDARQGAPVLSLDEHLQGVELGALLADLRGKTKVSGRTDLNARLIAQGETVDSLKRTLSGSADVRITDGAFHGMNVTRTICEGLAGRPISPRAAGDQALTRFTSLTGTAVIRDGVVSNQDLVASSPLLRIAGAGGASLVTERLNYGARVTLEDRCQSEGTLQIVGVDFSQVAREGIPLRCQGSFDDPSCGVDSQFVQSLVTQQVIQRVIGGKLGGGQLGGGQPGGGQLGGGQPGGAAQGESGSAIQNILQGILKQQQRR